MAGVSLYEEQMEKYARKKKKKRTKKQTYDVNSLSSQVTEITRFPEIWCTHESKATCKHTAS